jgi:tRNA threonylcarbamoyladenosine modification (KEOPS) complex  Pcc1 subunit
MKVLGGELESQFKITHCNEVLSDDDKRGIYKKVFYNTVAKQYKNNKAKIQENDCLKQLAIEAHSYA